MSLNLIENPRKLWSPDPSKNDTNIHRLIKAINARYNLKLNGFKELKEWSDNNIAKFWEENFLFLDFLYEGKVQSPVVDESARMDSIPKWFAGVKLNFGENVLFSANPAAKPADKIAGIEVREGGIETCRVTYGELRKLVGRYANCMKALGVKKGDRVGVVAANSIKTLALVTAVSTIGAIFSTASPDTGATGILDRMVQIEPTAVFFDDAAIYNGKSWELVEKMRQVGTVLAKTPNLKAMISIPRFDDAPRNISSIPKCISFDDFLLGSFDTTLVFERVDFSTPCGIVFSSGTSGAPKCIVHSHGGFLLVGSSSYRFDADWRLGSTCMQYTTTGWIMYLAVVQSVVQGATTVMYDGSPFQRSIHVLLELLQRYKISYFGTSPRYLSELMQNRIRPREYYDLSELTCVTITGMVCPPPVFEWFYDEGFPQNVRLNNITGGTDLAATIGSSNPLLPVYSGEVQTFTLGLVGGVRKGTSDTEPCPSVACAPGEPGELVVTKVFPSMPCMFWGKDGAKKYYDSYFSKFDNVWCQQDLAVIHPKTGGFVMIGRSDGVLNPSGVRFGSAEIYTVVEKIPDILDSVCVGQRRVHDKDESVFLFVKMRPGYKFTKDLIERIRGAIRSELSVRHVPKYIFETPDIPTTVNMKKVEVPIKKILCGERVKPSGTLANPESLEFYYQFVDVEKLLQNQSKL
ncbi:hypothetical protein CANCADRAFT_31223 [Tortispora caseinolytica NRRL Y-17796]|uniref:AMP-dependent synthetase/ligase domain-containing protein n=1 Tax=Tortispora caseinolytica NRRL Y-17796 TaxID=767744 RepID=A0A1E4TEK6_9ASCO|nr:hypothetical protein CANCADRAFT_31223 [Tortispora caseinolytica NRRL Y-17796]